MNVKKWKNYFTKASILEYIVIAFIKCFLITVPIVGLLFAGLWLTGVYPKLESWLNLGYDSPFVRVPMTVFAALALLSFVIGALLYFYKYKRKKRKSEFRKVVLEVFADAGTD